MSRARLVPLLLLLLWSLPVSPAWSAGAAETRAELEDLRERIEEVRSALARERQREDRTETDLERIERRIGDIATRLQQTQVNLQQARDELGRLDARRTELDHELEAHRDTLASQLRAAYRLGRQPALRLALRQNEPARLARALGYYGYFNAARLDAIDRTEALMREVRAVERETEQTRRQLQAELDTLKRQREELESARVERRRILQRLRASIADKGERLQRMEADREELERLLDRLGSVLADIPAAPLEERPFGTRTGELQWPVDGNLRDGFGAPRAEGRMRSRGLVIAAESGTPVRAVYYGRVVFADWFSGFGQLLIIDHLDGYLSLYGYNQRLLRSAGDWVTPGEPIATVGDSGGQSRPGLYFEIRRDGQPVNPERWLAQR
jgi:septal ring factor EnvC (AmiA/AmiB activator)